MDKTKRKQELEEMVGSKNWQEACGILMDWIIDLEEKVEQLGSVVNTNVS